MINARLDTYIESNNVLEWEQAGFRKGYSCLDQTYILSSIVDFPKCFDWVDRSLMLYRLNDINIGGNMLHCIKNIYNKTYSRIRLNGIYRPSFEVTSGVRQGDSLPPLLNNLVLDSLAKELKAMQCGVKYGDIEISLLMCTDDLVIKSETPEKLQHLLNCLNDWYIRWQMKVNIEKSNVMDFRRQRQELDTTVFRLGANPLKTVSTYKYLRYYLDEHLTFLDGCNMLSVLARRSLSAIIHKMRMLKGERYGTYSKLYDSCVAPILEYFAGICSSSDFECITRIHHRAIRFYIGVPKNTTTFGISAEMTWLLPKYGQFVCTARLYKYGK